MDNGDWGFAGGDAVNETSRGRHLSGERFGGEDVIEIDSCVCDGRFFHGQGVFCIEKGIGGDCFEFVQFL